MDWNTDWNTDHAPVLLRHFLRRNEHGVWFIHDGEGGDRWTRVSRWLWPILNRVIKDPKGIE